jgi:hypothetical protein
MGTAAMTIPHDTYTFLGTTPEGEPVFMDIAALSTARDALAHADKLLGDHASGAFVEVWRGASLVAKTPRASLVTR